MPPPTSTRSSSVLFYATGLRLSEALNVTFDDIDRNIQEACCRWDTEVWKGNFQRLCRVIPDAVCKQLKPFFEDHISDEAHMQQMDGVHIQL